MQCPGEQLLPGAALAFEQHGRIGRRGAVQLLRHLPQVRVLADDARRPAPLRELFLQEDVLGVHPPLRHRARDNEEQVVGIDGLGQEVQRPFLHGHHRVLNAAVRGHDDDHYLGVEVLGRAQHAEPVALGQLQVGQDDRRPRLSQLLHGLRLVTGLDDDVALPFEGMPHHRAQ